MEGNAHISMSLTTRNVDNVFVYVNGTLSNAFDAYFT